MRGHPFTFHRPRLACRPFLRAVLRLLFADAPARIFSFEVGGDFPTRRANGSLSWACSAVGWRDHSVKQQASSPTSGLSSVGSSVSSFCRVHLCMSAGFITLPEADQSRRQLCALFFVRSHICFTRLALPHSRRYASGGVKATHDLPLLGALFLQPRSRPLERRCSPLRIANCAELGKGFTFGARPRDRPVCGREHGMGRNLVVRLVTVS